jgi:hypothetical protein
MSTSEFTQNDKRKLERILNFPFIGSKESFSYETTIPRKKVIQGGLVQETTINKGTKTTTTRMQTVEEKIRELERILKV